MQTLLNTPHEIIQQNILGAAAKAKTRILNILVLGIMAGSFIAMGAQSSSLAVHNISNVGLADTGRLYFPGWTDDDRLCGRRIIYRRLYDVYGMDAEKNPFCRYAPYPGSGVCEQFCRCSSDRVPGGPLRPV